MVDKDFYNKNLCPPWEYDIAWSIAVDDRNGTWVDAKNGVVDLTSTTSVPYFRFLPGDRECAITEAQAIIASMTKSADAE